MWIIRFLNGPNAGQTEVLKKGATLIGRAPNCDIKVLHSNISKEHLQIEIFDDKVILTDAGSRNGSYLNGVQIRSSKAQSGDKVAIHDIFFEIQNLPPEWVAKLQATTSTSSPHPTMTGAVAHESYTDNMHYQAQAGIDHQPLDNQAPELHASAEPNFLQGQPLRLAQTLHAYIERVVLPSLFKLPEMVEFKWVMAAFMAVFILLVTALSTLPLIRILKASIEEESQQHAVTIATTLARINLPALQQGLDSSLSVELATSRPGVKSAYVISNVDGNILSPASQAGTYPQLPHVHAGRKSDRDSVMQVDDSTVVAMVPMRFFNAETGSQAVVAWAVVYYDMASLAVDNNQVISLFVTTLFIALLLGMALFYLLFKLIEYPVRSLNSQLDVALKDGEQTVTVSYKFPALQLLASNVSSALARVSSGTPADNGAPGRVLEHDRGREITNLVELIGFAAMGIKADDLSIAAINQAFESRVGSSMAHLTSSSIHDLSDQALKLSIKDLIERVERSPDEIVSNELEFSGANFQIAAQAIYGSSKIAYFLIVLLPAQEGGG